MALERDHKTGQKGPLHGIPVSIKENYYIKVLFTRAQHIVFHIIRGYFCHQWTKRLK